VKWQIELIEREGIMNAKQRDYLAHMQEATELGITLTKHAHVAGRVIAGAYDTDGTSGVLSSVIQAAALGLRAQYERHGVTLEAAFDEETHERTFDKELVGLLVWSLAKYFLACTPAQSTVSMRGMGAPAGEDGVYVLICSALDIPECEECVKVFNTQEARGAYDQAFVFAKLVHDVATLLHADVSANAQGTSILVEATFRHTTAAE
jgi:hypothetical protein